MNAFFTLVLVLGLMSACKHTQDREVNSSNEEAATDQAATAETPNAEVVPSEGGEAQLVDVKTQTAGLIKQHLPYMSSKKTLTVYDACKDVWIDTGLPFRTEPKFPNDKPTINLRKPALFYKVGDKRVRLHEVDIYNLDKHVLLGKANVPKSFRGLWWMDGNPAPEIVLSFAHVVYDKPKGTMTAFYNEQDSYLMQPSPAGIALWDAFLAAKVQLNVRVPKTIDMDKLKFGDQIFVDIGLFRKVVVKTGLMPTTYINDQHWKRETGEHCYNFRQIVDENGRKTPVYDRFVKNVIQQTKDGKGTNPEILIMPKNFH